MTDNFRSNIKNIIQLCNIDETLIIEKDFSIGETTETDITIIFSNAMSNRELINRDILKPLMHYFKGDLPQDSPYEYILKRILPFCIAYIESNTDKIISEIHRGRTVLIVGQRKDAIVLDTIDFIDKGLKEPVLSSAILNSNIDFSSGLLNNTVLIKRYIKDKELTKESFVVGKRSQTDIAIMYLKDVTNKKLIKRLKEKIKNIDVDSVISLGVLGQHIEENPASILPQNYIIDSPEYACKKILDGKIIILMDGCSHCLCVPHVFHEIFRSYDDYIARPIGCNFARIIRMIALVNILTLPATYIALTKFSPVLLSSKFVQPIIVSREGIALSPFLEILIMEIMGEILREGGIRLPVKIGQTLSIIGGIIIGNAAIESNIVSTTALFVVGISICSSFVISGYEISTSVRALKFPIMIMANVFGIIGIVIVWYIIIIYICELEVFGIEYLSLERDKYSQDGVFRKCIKAVTERQKIYKIQKKK